MAAHATLWALVLLLVIAHGQALPFSGAAREPVLGGGIVGLGRCSDELARSAVAALVEGEAPGPSEAAAAWHGGSDGREAEILAYLLSLPEDQAAVEGRVAVVRDCPKCAPADPSSCLACSIPADKLVVLFLPSEHQLHQPERRQGAPSPPWLVATPEATQLLGEVFVRKMTEAGAAVEAWAGDFPLALELDVNEALFAPQGPLEKAAGAFFVRGAKLVLNPRWASRFSRYMEDPAHLSSLGAHLSDLNATIKQAEPLDLGNRSASISSLVQLRRRLMTSRLKELNTLSSIPFKCLACIVLMGTLVPIAVNVILQGLGAAYCQAESMSPEECDKVRFMMMGIGIALMPFEVVPVAAACTTNHRCKDDPPL